MLKNIPNTTETARALEIMKTSFEALGYDDYAKKITNVALVN